MREIPAGLMFDGQSTARTTLLIQARDYLITVKGMNTLDVEDRLADRQGLVVRAWWGGDGTGFVSETHPTAQPVTVVHC